jgi:phospholipid/cholesterol/gamma-HCH transport system substrate-binding protein
MRKFRERNLYIIAAVSAAFLLLVTYLALNFTHLPVVSNQKTYRADFSTGLGLTKGDVVTIAGVRVGSVNGLKLQKNSPEGPVARISFSISGGYHLGSLTRADAKVINPVGVEYVELTPAGPGRLSGPIPLSRTTSPGTLTGDLNQLASDTAGTDVNQLTKSIEVLTQTLAGTAPATTRAAIQGIANLSEILANHQSQISDLIVQADQLTSTLNQHSGQLVQLLGSANLVLQVLSQRKAAINQLLTTTGQLTAQLDHIIVGDQAQLDPLLNDLQSVSTFLARDSNAVSAAMPLLAAFDRYAANATGSGPYADVVSPTLVLPDNVFKQCSAIQNSITALLGCRP